MVKLRVLLLALLILSSYACGLKGPPVLPYEYQNRMKAEEAERAKAEALAVEAAERAKAEALASTPDESAGSSDTEKQKKKPSVE